MAFSYGFYNSLNGDRKYNAEQFSVLISCLITDGVLDNWGSMLMARPGTGGLSIVLGSGRAWFNDTWNENDSDIPFDLEFADPLLSRIDTLVLEVDKTVGIRANRVFIAKGTPATNAVPTTLSNGPDIFQHALAYITVEPNAQTITADKIQILVGTEACPFITSILEQASIEELFAGWEYQFDTWFEELQTKLSGDVAAKLQYEIYRLDDEIKDTNKKIDAGFLPKEDVYIKIVSSTSWTVPNDIYNNLIDVVLAGGSGAGTRGMNSSRLENGIPGGPGEIAIKRNIDVSTFQFIDITIGTGGITNGKDKVPDGLPSTFGSIFSAGYGTGGECNTLWRIGKTITGNNYDIAFGQYTEEQKSPYTMSTETYSLSSVRVRDLPLVVGGNGGKGASGSTNPGGNGSNGWCLIHYKRSKSTG